MDLVYILLLSLISSVQFSSFLFYSLLEQSSETFEVFI